MAQDTSVKFFFGSAFGRTHTAAPRLSNEPGGLITILDACLVNGFGEVQVESLKIDAYGVGTITTAVEHGYQVKDARIVLAGADQIALNREWVIQDIPSPNTLTIDASGFNLEDSTATGAITCKMAALGWTKEYEATNKAVYRAKGGHRAYLYVDDTPSNGQARVVGYRNMQSISVGTDPFPTQSQLSGGGYWSHGCGSSYYGNSDGGKDLVWHLIGNDRFFYLGMVALTSQTGHERETFGKSCYFFGEFPSYKSDDVNNLVLECSAGAVNTTNNRDSFRFGYSYPGKFIVGRANEEANSQRRFAILKAIGSSSSSSSSYSSYYSIGYVFNDNEKRNRIIGGGFFLAHPNMIYSESEGLRGYMPGMYICPQNTSPSNPIVFENTIYTDRSGRKFFVAPHAYHSIVSAVYSAASLYFIRIDKDWNDRNE